MNPKDLALTLWALARLDYPASDELKYKLVNRVMEVLVVLKSDPKLPHSTDEVDLPQE